MSSPVIRYDLWIEDALRGVVRRALHLAADEGLPGEHHFYLTFDTTIEGVHIPGYLKAQHPDEMTIVIQHQYKDLAVEDDHFAVTLRFKGKPERLIVPFAAMTAFADPSVNFGLQLRMTLSSTEQGEGEDGFAPDIDDARQDFSGQDTDQSEAKSGEVIALDAFRKK